MITLSDYVFNFIYLPLCVFFFFARNSLSVPWYQSICGSLHVPIWPLGFPWWLSGKEAFCNIGDTGDVDLIPGSGRSPREGNGNPLQYFSQDNPKDWGAWWATIHGVADSQTWLIRYAQHIWPLDIRTYITFLCINHSSLLHRWHQLNHPSRLRNFKAMSSPSHLG